LAQAQTVLPLFSSRRVVLASGFASAKALGLCQQTLENQHLIGIWKPELPRHFETLSRFSALCERGVWLQQ